jgi:hypothetical protein
LDKRGGVAAGVLFLVVQVKFAERFEALAGAFLGLQLLGAGILGLAGSDFAGSSHGAEGLGRMLDAGWEVCLAVVIVQLRALVLRIEVIVQVVLPRIGRQRRLRASAAAVRQVCRAFGQGPQLCRVAIAEGPDGTLFAARAGADQAPEVDFNFGGSGAPGS